MALALAGSLALGACTQLSPASVDDFGAEKKVVVTLRDGETLRGRIRPGESVKFTTFGRVYRAEVESVDDNGNIVLSGAYLQEQYEAYDIQRSRMEGSELRIQDDGSSRISIPAYKITKVEEISMDRAKSARAAVFWGFTVFVVSQVMSSRL